MDNKRAFYLILSAAAAAAAAVPMRDLAAQTCGCEPTSVVRTQQQASFLPVPGSSTKIFADVVQDTEFGFTTSVAPSVWLDWDATGSGSNYALSAQVCRVSYSGVSVACAPSANSPTPVANTHYEIGLPVTGTYAAEGTSGYSHWDRVKVVVTGTTQSPSAAGANMTLPNIVQAPRLFNVVPDDILDLLDEGSIA